MYTDSGLSLGGAARLQQAAGSTQINSVYLRGSLQVNVGRFSAFANLDHGNDLANRSVFATNTYNTSVFGMGLKLWCAWNLHAEAFRNSLIMELNPESVFVLQGSAPERLPKPGVAQPVSLYFSVTKQFRWRRNPAEGIDRFAAEAAPLVGTVEGLVRIRTLSGAALAAGIPITLDRRRIVTSGSDGRYFFSEVPEGQHEVALSLPNFRPISTPANPTIPASWCNRGAASAPISRCFRFPP